MYNTTEEETIFFDFFITQKLYTGSIKPFLLNVVEKNQVQIPRNAQGVTDEKHFSDFVD